ncbi:hypothetical protein Bhyg_05032, partial [Pseudolycoriella hygida]
CCNNISSGISVNSAIINSISSLTPCGVVNNEIVYSHVGAQLNTTGPAISNDSGKRKLMESANSIMDHQKRSKSGDERNITNIHGIETYNQFSELDEDNSNITSHMDLNNASSALPPLLFTTNNTKRKTSNESKPVNYVVKGIDRSFDNEVVRDAIAAQCPKVVILKRPGHAASNCNMKYRCMKCLNDHDPGKCPRTEQLELVKARGDANELEQFSKEVSCVNCGEIGHPANYKKCKPQPQLDRAFIATGSKDSQKCIRIKSEIKCLDIMARNSISSLYQSNFRTRLANIRKDNNMFLNIKSALGSRAHEKIPNFHVTANTLTSGMSTSNAQAHYRGGNSSDMIQVCNDHDKAFLLGCHYENIHKQNVGIGDKNFTKKVEDEIHEWVQNSSIGEQSTIREPM